MPEPYVPKEAITHGDGGTAALAIGEAESLERAAVRGAARRRAHRQAAQPVERRLARPDAATRSSWSPGW